MTKLGSNCSTFESLLLAHVYPNPRSIPKVVRILKVQQWLVSLYPIKEADRQQGEDDVGPFIDITLSPLSQVVWDGPTDQDSPLIVHEHVSEQPADHAPMALPTDWVLQMTPDDIFESVTSLSFRGLSLFSMEGSSSLGPEHDTQAQPETPNSPCVSPSSTTRSSHLIEAPFKEQVPPAHSTQSSEVKHNVGSFPKKLENCSVSQSSRQSRSLFCNKNKL